MEKEDIIEITKNNYINIDTGEKASPEGIKTFKQKVKSGVEKTEKRIQERNILQSNFIEKHKQHIMDLDFKKQQER